MGAGARADAATYLVLATLIVWILNYKPVGKTLDRVVLSAAVVSISSFFYFSSDQSQAASREQASPFELSRFINNLENLPSLWAGSFGTWGLGWLDTGMPSVVWVMALGVFAGYLLLALNHFDRRKLVAILIVGLALVVVPMYILTRENISVGVGVQPRYLLPLLALLLLTFIYPVGRKGDLKLNSGQFFAVASALVIANAVALQTNLRRYVTGTDFTGSDFDKNLEWWWPDFPISPMGILFIGSISGLMLAIGIAYLARADKTSSNDLNLALR
jgi:hypothetical protein